MELKEMTDQAKWDVFKGDLPGSSWKWVARYDGKVIATFPTKKKAMEFVAQYIKEGAN
tara:strand:+ start:747 stop:920 length:174 start_codon:yes stop_codon:yes gene_type:complete